ncbi:FAD-dependent oxidoreductase [Bradyrhizobium canariense]|uniref:Flavin containing amine oxidoreductase n=1 Tax=Bradyrhizobium canariense TaxID=255045 RepID=A0A1H2BKY7_9BRAD|nr:FAD-dependent oxidoreductase [Bradyrhizobium canariense]SDT58436.1 Flavin containing amine oxidoreductase [Bradyrhizobium canariense]
MLAGARSLAEATEHYEAIVLGAGVSGLVSASVLLAQGYRRILVTDAYDHVGGNHIDWSTGDYTFDAGSFIFQDDSPLLRHFPELLPRYTPIFPDWGRLNPQGVVTAYPISVKDDIVGAGPMGWIRIFSSLLYARLFQRKIRNAKEFARYWIGGYLLHSSGLEAYMKRFYGVPPDEIDIQLAQKRMLWISEHASLANLIRRLLPQSKGPANRQLIRPKEGFSHLYKVAAERLEEGGVTFVLGASFQALEKNDKTFCLRMNDRTVSSDRVISTIPINHVEAMCGFESEKLNSITLLSLFFSFSGQRGFSQSILYNFSHEGTWKRLTMHSDFYGRVNGREYFAAEVIANDIDFSTPLAEQNFRKHVQANGLFEGDLKLEGSMILENAYPIYTERSGARAAEAIRSLKAFGIESFGRQGGFDYQPTARVSTIEAESALNR